MPHHPGLGLSIHPSGYGYAPAEHAVVIRELVDHPDLSDMVVMGQDWGGPDRKEDSPPTSVQSRLEASQSLLNRHFAC